MYHKQLLVQKHFSFWAYAQKNTLTEFVFTESFSEIVADYTLRLAC